MRCIVEDCDLDSSRRSMCYKHYMRWWKYGDPTVCKTAPKGEPLRFLYENVLTYKGEDCLLWPYACDSSGYGMISINNKLRHVHLVVCETIHGPRPSPEHVASHKCGNGCCACVNPRHLKWQTRIEDQADRVTHGTSNRGSQHGNSKLTEQSIREIRSLEGRFTHKEIAEKFGVSRPTISLILARKMWDWLD